ncbi:MAG TPA: ChrR family anti-sigma-E factor [Micropepsaceae bacterium]|nr:ChrR family anti-sigma-E factor [Micropepsaceae bacterium]
MQHHPPDEYLIDLAAGAASDGVKLLLETHLAMCPPCQTLRADIEQVGGILLEEEASAGLAPMPELGSLRAPAVRMVRPVVQAGAGDVPDPLRNFVGASFEALAWRTVWPGVQELPVPGIDRREGLKLLRIRQGMALPNHTHEGDELTLVLKGGYKDATGHYQAGDIALADEHISHQPKADWGDACICLTAVERPLRFNGLIARTVSRLFIRNS